MCLGKPNLHSAVPEMTVIHAIKCIAEVHKADECGSVVRDGFLKDCSQVRQVVSSSLLTPETSLLFANLIFQMLLNSPM